MTNSEQFCDQIEKLDEKAPRVSTLGPLKPADITYLRALFNSQPAMLRVIRAAEAYVNRPSNANQFRLVASLDALPDANQFRLVAELDALPVENTDA